MNEVELVLAVTQSDSLSEALGKLESSRKAVADGHIGPIDGVDSWESPESALVRLDSEIEHVAILLLEEQLDDQYEVEHPVKAA